MTADQKKLRPDDIYRLRVVNEVCLSPDSRQAAITIAFADGDKDEYRSAIALVDVKTGTLRNVTPEDKKSWSPQFSPDGSNLAFLSDRSGVPQLWILPLSGGEPEQRTFFKNGVSNQRWSPDSKRIAFLSGGGEKETVAQPDAEKPEDKPKVRVLKSIRHKEDGRGYFQDKINHVFIVDAAGAEPVQLTSGDDEDKSIAWSPDGSHIAFVSNRTGDQSSDVSDVWSVEARPGGTSRCLTTSSGVIDVPIWSADGTQLSVIGHPGLRSVGKSARVALVPASGSEPKFVTDPQKLNFASVLIAVGHAGWLPEPRWTKRGLVALANERGRQNLYSVGEDGKTTSITDGNQCVFGFDASADGSLVVFTAGHMDDPVNLYAASGGNVRRLTDLNPWLRELQQPEIETFTYVSDGDTQIDAWLVHPPAMARSAPRPLVLLIHGGPHCAYGYAWIRNALMYAAQGYRVLFVNPRGSAGYGEEFARAIHPMQGDVDEKDLLAGVAAAIERGGVDERRIGVTGGSYGGFMTNMLISRSDRFASAVTLACICNWLSYYGTADYGWMMAWEFEDEFWQAGNRYVSQSPITYADKIKTPVLILHGEDDLRCPIEQAEQLFALLQRRGIKSEMRRYPGEPHGIGSRRPSFAVDVLQSAIDWFNATLMPS